MPPEHLDEDITTTTTIATRWNNAKGGGLSKPTDTHADSHTHTHMEHDEVFSALFLYRRKERVRWASRRECFTMTKWQLHVRRTFPPWGQTAFGVWRGAGGKLLFEIKNRSKEDATTGNMRALPARRDSQNYYRKNGQKGQLWTAGTSG